jgi:hypothetical protein
MEPIKPRPLEDRSRLGLRIPPPIPPPVNNPSPERISLVMGTIKSPISKFFGSFFEFF